jgi:D-alanyl-D-alanine carboxypeptidase/D-alanyl-D-alanine-endopeptidase (penicillin-binding protein 4)
MTPASVTKSFTAYSALKYLKEDFVYHTAILEDSNNLYFKFSGDPNLNRDDLTKLILQIKLHLFKQIIIDDTKFDQIYRSNGQSWEDTKFCFAAPINSSILGNNCFTATLAPNPIINKPAVFMASTKIFADINNQITTKNDPSCVPELIANSNNSYQLNGCIDINSSEIKLNIAYQDPRLMMKSLIQDLLKQNKIYFNKSEIIFQEAPKNAVMIANHQSPPLRELIKKMHKDSDNLIADVLLKTIGAEYYKKQGDFVNGVKALQEILKLSDFRIVDGSGSSRYNLLSVEHLVNLFSSAYKDKAIRMNFIASLPISAQDGTLRTRFLNYPDLQGKIFAKTGYMSGVSSIAGYISDEIVFAIIVNGYIGSKKSVDLLIEEIIATIYQ